MMIVPSRIVCGVIDPCGSAVLADLNAREAGEAEASVWWAPDQPLTSFCVIPGLSAWKTAS
jgi:hypothetical protein